jgi:maltooligosyltrehalose trehalohydrolase
MPGSATTPSSPRAIQPRTQRRLPVGAEYVGDGQTHVRVWAPAATRVDVVVDSDASTPLGDEGNGYFGGFVGASPGARYQFRLDTADLLLPDPASRFQPHGPHGASVIVDPVAFRWTDDRWRGATLEGQVVYEMHVGTFSGPGTWAGATDELPELARLGITMIEVMPVAEFEGRYGWGYDGVDLFAPTRLYGEPDDFRRFVDAAHGAGIAVMLDVVYNHFGPVGNYLRMFSPAYFTDRYENEWGDAINFDGPDAAPVREFFETNARYWISEFHLDGLRLDATQQIFDQSPDNIIAVIGRAAREAAAGRPIVIVAENEPQNTVLVKPLDQGGYGLDALWNDDYHHSAMVALTGRSEAYYSDTRGVPQEFISAAKYGYLFQGQLYSWQRKPRGTPGWELPPAAFVTFLQNHDQVANSAHGRRGHELTSPGRWRAMTALTLLMPGTPMLFQGQEFSASTPFLYFADFEPELAAAVCKGRGDFLMQFPSVKDFLKHGVLADPGDPSTFGRCKLDLRERTTHAAAYALHADLLRLRRENLAFRRQALHAVDGAVLSASAFALRFFTPDHADDRLLIVNLGADLKSRSFAEPLLAPPDGTDWTTRWSSEDPAYGGTGSPNLLSTAGWHVTGESAIVLEPGPRQDPLETPKRRRTA